MSREEFLRELEGLLSGLPEEERADALAFYRSYFEDAGEANEASILAELESPKKVADTIRSNLGMDHAEPGTKEGRQEEAAADSGTGETGFVLLDDAVRQEESSDVEKAPRTEERDSLYEEQSFGTAENPFESDPYRTTGNQADDGAGSQGNPFGRDPYRTTGNQADDGAGSQGNPAGRDPYRKIENQAGDSAYGNRGYTAGRDPYAGSSGRDRSAAVAVGIILAVLTSPLWFALLIVVLCVLLAVTATLFGIAIAVVAVMAALLFTGVVLFGSGIGMLFGGHPAVGIGLMGGGLIVFALGLLAVVLMVWVFGAFLPWSLRGLGRVVKMPFDRRKERAAV